MCSLDVYAVLVVLDQFYKRTLQSEEPKTTAKIQSSNVNLIQTVTIV